MKLIHYVKLDIDLNLLKIKMPAPNSVYNQLLGSGLRTVSLWGTLVYLDTESLWQRK